MRIYQEFVKFCQAANMLLEPILHFNSYNIDLHASFLHIYNYLSAEQISNTLLSTISFVLSHPQESMKAYTCM